MLKNIGLILVFLLGMLGLNAQGYLDFIENKGQWPSAIQFKSELSASAFALTKNGYRVLQHNVADYAAIADSRHIHSSNSAPENKSDVRPKFGQNEDQALTLRSHVYEVKFLNANPNPTIVKEKPLGGVSNYFIGNDPTKWATDCKTFQSVTYKSMYPNIDVRYYTNNGVLKYDIIVHPGGDPSKIILYFEGTEGISLKNGALQVNTSVGVLQETVPYTYQLIGGERTELECGYEVKGNLVKFKLSNQYNRNSTLVIDPQPVFISYSGSRADNWGFTATYDLLGNFYAGGIVFSSGFPTTNGAFQSNYQNGVPEFGLNGYDMGILKFEPGGTSLIYATYIGGSGNEQPHSLVADAAGNLVIAGRTSSGANYPSVTGSPSLYGDGGDFDIALTKINPLGTALIGSIRVGGKGKDGINIRPNYDNPQGPETTRRNYGDDARSEVIFDNQGNILLASVTQSTDFPTTVNAFQRSSGAARTNTDKRMQDGVLIKLNANLSQVIFSSFLGGNNDDAAFVLAINPANQNIYVAGATASTDMPAKSNAIPSFQNNNGSVDGFISIVSPDGSRIISTSYIGTDRDDIIFGIQFDRQGFPYIVGTTNGVLTPINSPYNNTNPSQSTGKQFIAKLQPDLTAFIYRANFGTSGASIPNLSISAFLVDRCGNVYVSGWGGSNINSFPTAPLANLPLTADAYQSSTDGADFYFFVLERDAQRQLYGSYFGQTGGFADHVDGGTSRFDPNGTIYQSICSCRRTGDPSRPIVGTGGAWSTTNRSNSCNLLAIKIAFNLAGVGGGIKTAINGVARDTSGCVPLTVVFSDTLEIAKSYRWNFNDGSPEVITSNPSVTHTFNNVGVYNVRLIAIDSASCNISDTSFIRMRVKADEATLAFTPNKLLPCESLTYRFDNTSFGPKPFGANAFRWDFGDGTKQVASFGPVTHTYATAGSYNVRLTLIDTSFCNEFDSVGVQLRISPLVKAQFQTPSLGCVPYTAVFNNTSLAGRTFRWDFGDGNTSTQTSPQHLYATIGTYTVKLVAIDSSTCNIIDSTVFTISVRDNPTAGISFSPDPTEANTPVTFTNNSFGANRYKWLFGDGDTLNTLRSDTTVRHLYNASGTFNACVIAYNDAGCSDTSCVPVPVTIIPGFNVANAFSPNGDGTNDRIFVRGFGIVKMTWKIYNRWGKLVYLGTSQSEGWDGKYNGKLQPQEVYHYTLELEFSDKERATKKGDITLLR
jgi:gliding motility-associated-like protein